MLMIKQPILPTYIVCHSNDFYINYILEPYVATFHFFCSFNWITLTAMIKWECCFMHVVGSGLINIPKGATSLHFLLTYRL